VRVVWSETWCAARCTARIWQNRPVFSIRRLHWLAGFSFGGSARFLRKSARPLSLVLYGNRLVCSIHRLRLLAGFSFSFLTGSAPLQYSPSSLTGGILIRLPYGIGSFPPEIGPFTQFAVFARWRDSRSASFRNWLVSSGNRLVRSVLFRTEIGLFARFTVLLSQSRGISFFPSLYRST
jgi:hypothetical protein